MVAKTNRFWAFVAKIEENLKRKLGFASRQQQIPFPQASTVWPFYAEDVRDTTTTNRRPDQHDTKRVLAFLARDNGAVAESDEMVWDDTEDYRNEQDRLAFEAAFTRVSTPTIPAQFIL